MTIFATALPAALMRNAHMDREHGPVATTETRCSAQRRVTSTTTATRTAVGHVIPTSVLFTEAKCFPNGVLVPAPLFSVTMIAQGGGQRFVS